MSRPLFTVVIPTLGRPSLPKTLASIRDQTQYGDAEILVIVDTHQARAGLVESVRGMTYTYSAAPIHVLEFDAGRHDTGSPQLHLGYLMAAGQYVLNLGDDDVYEPNAFETIGAAIADQDVMHPLMFKVELHPAPHRGNHEPVVLWDRQEIAEGHVTGQGFVCPNDRRLMGRWVNDWTFMRETVTLHGGRIEWREELIARCY